MLESWAPPPNADFRMRLERIRAAKYGSLMIRLMMAANNLFSKLGYAPVPGWTIATVRGSCPARGGSIFRAVAVFSPI